MVERLHSVSLTDFDTQSAGAELLVAAGGITVNAVNKIAVVNLSESRLCPVGDELWYVRLLRTGIVQKISQADLSSVGTITLQWTGLNAKWDIGSICVVGNFIYGYVAYKDATTPKAIGKWDLAGNLIDEFIDYVNPPADGELWGYVNKGSDMVSDGTFLYVTQDPVVKCVKKFDLAGNFQAKCVVSQPRHVFLGQDGYLYSSDDELERTYKIDPVTMTIETGPVATIPLAPWHYHAKIVVVDDSRVYKAGVGGAVSIQGMSADNDYRGAFGGPVLANVGKHTVATGRPPGTFYGAGLPALVGDYFYVTSGGGYGFENTVHKIYVKENRTVHTAAPVITDEGDLKVKTGLVGPSYKRLAVRDDVDGGEITYYRSSDGVAWTEVTRASGFDLSGHSVADPLYLKVHLDNLCAKVGDPIIYGIDIIAEGNPPDDYVDIRGIIPDDDEIIEAVLHE